MQNENLNKKTFCDDGDKNMEEGEEIWSEDFNQIGIVLFNQVSVKCTTGIVVVVGKTAARRENKSYNVAFISIM